MTWRGWRARACVGKGGSGKRRCLHWMGGKCEDRERRRPALLRLPRTPSLRVSHAAIPSHRALRQTAGPECTVGPEAPKGGGGGVLLGRLGRAGACTLVHQAAGGRRFVRRSPLTAPPLRPSVPAMAQGGAAVPLPGQPRAPPGPSPRHPCLAGLSVARLHLRNSARACVRAGGPGQVLAGESAHGRARDGALRRQPCMRCGGRICVCA